MAMSVAATRSGMDADFRDRVVRSLRALDVDFAGRMASIRASGGGQRPWSASVVLVPIEFDERSGGHVIVLTKRSPYVPQPGDLCCPGGGMDLAKDALLGRLIARRYLPVPLLGSLKYLRGLEGRQRSVFALLWAAVLRECWEEIRLRPWNVEFLGALPVQQLQNFPTFIFPMVGSIKSAWRPRLNHEVERIVRIPVRSFLDPSNYAVYSQRIPSHLRARLAMDRWELPCLVIEEEGKEEILWGATFRIVYQFVQTVTDLRPESIHPQRRIERDLPLDYFTGRPS